ncbi:SDR family NAD(P)-dependent oxidoreductase [Endozoicomonas numazuensis]|uniref:3-ketoacyl-ACP reductase n=1 Tax=Endozoicomonas numazuensis TaxID=1137799 RepID=A0A081NMR9_9GAMM|nr:SDR family NAD(P)-dependent oxidoreductase [Endozoicomonas numazuensis]KEQ19742.1 3-ketoacyl-ACP reductase [Endozoicomonas numazuensis]
MSNLEGKVAIVTGAGRGLGRAEAIQLAKQGARVIVNDLGGNAAAEEAAMSVVEEIKGFGGEAIAQLGDCADWNDSEAVFKAAIDTWGDLNILVNNAGFCRDKAIFNMTEDEFDSVVRVHLKGHFVNMRHATSYWRNKCKTEGKPVFGRLISTSSEAFLYGSAGQPNYAAAKAGIVAMTMGAAQIMYNYGVTANVICPRARTDMTNQGVTAQMFAKPEEGFDTFAPENVAPLVGYLASEQAANVSGEVFVVWGKEVTLVHSPSTEVTFKNGDAWTPDSLQSAMGEHFASQTPIRDGFAIMPQ